MVREKEANSHVAAVEEATSTSRLIQLNFSRSCEEEVVGRSYLLANAQGIALLGQIEFQTGSHLQLS